MRFSRLFLNRLQDQPEATDTVVVIDVLRSFTTAAVALSRGARAVYPVAAVSAAIELAAQLDDSVTVGAIAGGDPAPGFAWGNSPSELLQAELAGKAVVMSTAAGVRGLQRFHRARHLYAASLACAGATAELIRRSGAGHVCFVITGEWVDRDGDEDIACADCIEALLCGRPADPAVFARRVRESDFGRRFGQPAWPNLAMADLTLCAQVDSVDFAMPVRRLESGMLIQPVFR